MSGETVPLLKSTSGFGSAEVVPMKYRHIPAAQESYRKAFENDPLMEYLFASEKHPNTWKSINDYLNWMSGIYQKRMLTVDEGTAMIKYGEPGNTANLHIISFVLKVLSKLMVSAEGQKRWNEFEEKVKTMVEDLFGEEAQDMYDVQILATNPAAQGRGYGTAMMRYVMDKSDADGRAVWLITVVARSFYEQLGFITLHTALIGDDNPAWDKEPVSIHVMLYRPSKSTRELNVVEEVV